MYSISFVLRLGTKKINNNNEEKMQKNN